MNGSWLLDTVMQDLRYGLRSLRRSPGFTLAALLTLSLTIGAVSTVFTLANGMLFRAPAVEDPESLVVVSSTRREGRVLGWVSYADYAHLRDRSKTLQALASHYSPAPLWVTAGKNVKELNGAVVTANFFALLGAQPALGRFFREDEDQVPDRNRVAVLGYGLWRDWFGSSPEALGGHVSINGVPFTVIGVVPESFHGLTGPRDIYIPTMMLRVGYRWCDDAIDETCSILSMVGRLAEGRGLQEARAEMAALVPARWAQAKEGENTGLTVYAPRGAHDRPEPSEARAMVTLNLVAGVLLLVCCANLAGLLIARGSVRGRELAIRASLGAPRGRLVRHLMTESLLLAVGGGMLGVLLSLGLTRLLQATFYSYDNEGYRLYFDFSTQPVVIFAVLTVSVGAAFLFGLMPALWSIGAGATFNLNLQSTAGSPQSRVGRWLVGVQAAVAVALVAVAFLLMTSAQNVARGVNFEPSRIALMRLRPRLLKYPPDKARAFQREVVRRLEAVPGVETVSLVGTGGALFLLQGDVSLPEWASAGRQPVPSGFGEVGPGYFETLGTPVLRGREFDERDGLDSPAVAVVNQALARRLWPSGEVVGARVVVKGHAHEVVGVVADLPLQGRSEEPRPYVYVPYWQNAGQVDARYCVRVNGDPATMLPVLVREVNRVDPDVPVTETLTLSFQIEHGVLKPVRLSATFLGYAAGLAVLLSALGLYGTLAFSVSRRTKEIGIRMAVGARARDVFELILGEGMTVVLFGVGVGVALAVGGAWLVRHLLYGSSSGDAAIYAGTALLVVGVGLLACWIPARRAACVEPILALRIE